MKIRCERECTAQILYPDNKQKNKLFDKYEYRKMGITTEALGWTARLERVVFLIGKIIPGIFLNICNFSGHVKSIKILAREISTGKERTYHYVRTFSENPLHLNEAVDYLKSAIAKHLLDLPELISFPACNVILKFDDESKQEHTLSLAPQMTKTELGEHISNIREELLDQVTQKRASLERVRISAAAQAANKIIPLYVSSSLEYLAGHMDDRF